MKSSATIFSIVAVSCVVSEDSHRDSSSLMCEVLSSVAGDVSTEGDCSGVGDGVGFGVGLGVGFGVGVGFGDGLGLGVGVGLGDGDGLGVGVGVGFGVGLGFGDGVGFSVEEFLGRGVDEETGCDPVAVESGRTVGNVIGGLPEIVGATEGMDRGVGTGGATVSGEAVVRGRLGGGVAGTRLKVPLSVGIGDGVSNVSGGAVASGFTVAFGEGLAVAVGVGLGLALGLGLGDSSAAAGDFARKGVEAASCAHTNAAVARSAMAKANRRMWVYLRKILAATLARVCRRGQEHTVAIRRRGFGSV
jgi:hypothetical protein